MQNSKPTKLSRSSLQLFRECPYCFYIKIKHKITAPSSPQVSLNLKVDQLLKSEFDHFRQTQTAHPIMTQLSGNIIPFNHSDLGQWRHNFTGIQFLHPDYGFLLYGSIDDIWIDQDSQSVIIVDYKATSSKYAISQTRLDDYAFQLSFYNWLFHQKNFQTHHTNYILLANAHTPLQSDKFENKLAFTSQLIPLTNQTDIVEKTLQQAHECLLSISPPQSNPNCKFCNYTSKILTLNSQSSLPFEFV